MEIEVKRIFPNRPLCNVSISHNSATLFLGIHDETERKDLAKVFLNAAEELLSGLKDEDKP